MAVTATVTSTSCTTQQVVVDGREMSVDDAANLVFQQGQKAEAAGDLAAAKVEYQRVATEYTSSPRAGDALAKLGSMGLSERGCAGGIHYYEQLIAKFDDHPKAARARDVLAKCGGTGAAASSAEAKFLQSNDPAEKKEFASSAADAAIASGDFASGVRWLLRVRSLEDNEATRTAMESEITELVDSKVSFQDVRVLLEDTDGDQFPKDILTYKLGRIQYHVRDFVNANETLQHFVATYPRHPQVEGARALIALIDARTKVNATTIGVLLPLSGKLKAYGENVREAVRLALGEFEEKKDKAKDAPPPLNIVFRDTEGDPVVTANAVRDFVLVDGAIAIVGALFRVEAEAAAYKAQELGVPLLTVSSLPRITEIGPYVFRSGVTNAAQADALVEYAMDVLGMTKFAVLYPRHPYGENFLQLFWDRVEARSGEVRGVESYGSDDTTFTWPVKRIVGRDQLDLRVDYKRAIRECESQPDPYRRDRCKRKAKSDLKPIVDFDGLFIPDYPRTLSLIAPALAFEDIIVELDPRRIRTIEKTLDRKVKPVRLLGASGWNSPTLPEKAERYVENAIFTDGFFAGAEDKQTVEFVTAFRKQFSRTPILPEALFYDAVRMIKQVVLTSGPQTRNDLREALRRVDKFPGVTGETSFRAGQDAKKKVRILTIKDGNIVEAAPPSEKAPTPGGEGAPKTQAGG